MHRSEMMYGAVTLTEADKWMSVMVATETAIDIASLRAKAIGTPGDGDLVTWSVICNGNRRPIWDFIADGSARWQSAENFGEDMDNGAIFLTPGSRLEVMTDAAVDANNPIHAFAMGRAPHNASTVLAPT